MADDELIDYNEEEETVTTQSESKVSKEVSSRINH